MMIFTTEVMGGQTMQIATDERGVKRIVHTCPGCSGQVIGCECTRCGGLILKGISREASYTIVMPEWDPNAEDLLAHGEARYFHISGPGYQRHGWYNARTGMLVQIG